MKSVLKVSLVALLVAGIAYTVVSSLQSAKVAGSAGAKAIIVAEHGNGGV